MQNHLMSGLPKIVDYVSLVGSPEFRQLAAFSDDFVARHERPLKRYSRKWVADPLHQWSRQWEYPYVFERLKSLAGQNSAVRILDAGSGFTFFPYYLAFSFASARVYCVDSDRDLQRLFLRAKTSRRVCFCCSGLHELPFQDASLDVIYSISVLEHIKFPAGLVPELARVLRPGGRLLITFDVSVDGSRRMSIEEGRTFVESTTQEFDFAEAIPTSLRMQSLQPDILTTRASGIIGPNLLPWRFPKLMYRALSFVRGERFPGWPPHLAVFCVDLVRR